MSHTAGNRLFLTGNVEFPGLAWLLGGPRFRSDLEGNEVMMKNGTLTLIFSLHAVFARNLRALILLKYHPLAAAVWWALAGRSNPPNGRQQVVAVDALVQPICVSATHG